ncbi:MAG: hypothetical protein H6948_02125 [Zoogloeaceae bacterium]|nr:hypothetical protein [Zoogloeaceae bacterium]
MSEIKKLPEVMILAKHSIGDGTLTQWQLHDVAASFREDGAEIFDASVDKVVEDAAVQEAYPIPTAMLPYIDPRFWMPWHVRDPNQPQAQVPREALN